MRNFDIYLLKYQRLLNEIQKHLNRLEYAFERLKELEYIPSLKRSLCENMYRGLKQRIDILFILSHLFGMLIGYKAKRNKEIYKRFISHREEKSLFNLGQLFVITGFVDAIGVDISNFLKQFLLSDYR